MINELQLLAGTDIPFPEAQVSIHQPTLKEISYIGEDKFFFGCQLLKFSKDMLSIEDKSSLSNYTDFDILMQIVENKTHEKTISESVENMLYILTLLFPKYQIKIENKQIVLFNENETHYLNATNFLAFKKILCEIFNLSESLEGSGDYNPSGALARRIAEKLKKGHQKLAEQKGDGQKIALYSRYVSILAVGEHKDINSLMQYTIYQILDEYKRFSLKMQYDIYVQAKMAGAKDVKEPEDWMKDLYEEGSKEKQQLIF